MDKRRITATTSRTGPRTAFANKTTVETHTYTLRAHPVYPPIGTCLLVQAFCQSCLFACVFSVFVLLIGRLPKVTQPTELKMVTLILHNRMPSGCPRPTKDAEIRWNEQQMPSSSDRFVVFGIMNNTTLCVSTLTHTNACVCVCMWGSVGFGVTVAIDELGGVRSSTIFSQKIFQPS